MKLVHVSAVALIDDASRVLLAQRPEGKMMAGMWEFPGGKVEAGETPEQALFREIKEELAIELCQPCTSPLSFVSHAYEEFHLIMYLFTCRKWDGIPMPQEGQNLTWKTPQQMLDLPMPPADIPLLPILRDLLAQH